jgi:ubiquinone biosynthesis accessory factor UbiJ
LSGAVPQGKKATLGWPFSFALNRLLAAQPWARARLAPFAGEVVELRAPALPRLRFTILPGGQVDSGGGEPALVISFAAGAPFAAARGEEHLMRAVEVTGNARLAGEVMQLARHLRWDFEEDLSHLLGDVAAHRLAQAGRAFAAWHVDAAGRLAAAFADYVVEEQRLLVRRAEHADLASAVARLRDAVERLEKRVLRLD